MKVRFSLNRDDVDLCASYIYRDDNVSGVVGKATLIGALIGFIVAIPFADYFPTRDPRDIREYYVFHVGWRMPFMFVGILFSYYFSKWWFGSQAKNVFIYEQPTQTIKELEWDDKGIKISLAGSTDTFAWSSFKKIVETEDYFLLFPKRLNAQICPKRAFTDEEINSFRDITITKIKDHQQHSIYPVI